MNQPANLRHSESVGLMLMGNNEPALGQNWLNVSVYIVVELSSRAHMTEAGRYLLITSHHNNGFIFFLFVAGYRGLTFLGGSSLLSKHSGEQHFHNQQLALLIRLTGVCVCATTVNHLSPKPGRPHSPPLVRH